MIAEHKGEVPFVVYLLPFLAGIITALFINPQNTPVPLICLICTCVLFIFSNLRYTRLKLYNQQWIGGLLLHIILFVAGITTFQLRDDRNNANYFATNNADHLIVRVDNEPALKGKYWHCMATVLQANANRRGKAVSGKLMLTIMADSLTSISYGEELLIPANYKPVDPPFNPAAFNYKGYLANQHIYAQSFLYPGQYRVIGSNEGNPAIAYALKLRQQMVQRFKTNVKDTTAAAVASTLILGYKADLSPDILQAYSKTGTIHVLSVSGAHVAIVFAFINFLLSFMNGSRQGQWIKAVLSITLIWAYAMLTGFSPAVCRAAVMLTMYIVGKAGYRYNNSANMLAVSAFVLLLYDPLLIADVGFQLSYLAVLGLIMLQPIIYKWLELENKYVRKVWYYIAASLAAQLITFPLSAFYFHQFPLYFLISNLFIVIPSEVILFSGITAVLLGWIPFVGEGIFWVLEQTILLMNKGLLLIEHQPFSAIDKIWFTRYDCALLFIAVLAFFYFLHNRKTVILSASLVCLLIVSTSLTVQKINSADTKSIVFYSLSKHMAILFKSGNEGVLISDLRPGSSNYNYAVQPCIDSNRVENVHNININDDVETSYLKKRSSLIQFLNTRIIIYGPQLEGLSLHQKIKADYLYITGNPHTPLRYIIQNYDFGTMIIDGTNSTPNVKKLVSEADSLRIKYAVLKRNKSVVVLSN